VAFSFTVQEEIDLIRSIGAYEDLDGDYSSDAPSAPSGSTIIRLIDRANREAWEAWSASDEGWNTLRVNLTSSTDPTLSSSFVDLPSDCHRIRAVQFQVGPGLGYETLRRGNATDDLFTVVGSGYPLAYREFPTRLEILPAGAMSTVRLTYCPVAARITSTANTIPSTDGYDLYVAYWTLIRLRQREEKDTSEFRASLAEVKASFLEKVRRRDRSQSMRMRPRGTVGRWPVRPRNL
jgi:hypothetical protein